METIWQDLRQGSRLLARQPVFAVVAIVSIALGVGLNSAIFSYLNALLLHPFPLVREPDRLAAIYSQDTSSPVLLPVSFPNFEDLRRENKSFSDVAAFQIIQVGMVLGKDSQQVYGEMVTASFFDVLGIKPELGRMFLPEEERAPSPVAVLSHDTWTERLAASPGVIGKVIRLNGYPFTVIGIAPQGFRGTNAVLTAAVWVPASMRRQVFPFFSSFDQRSGRVVRMIGRLKAGVRLVQAQGEMESLAGSLAAQFPDDNRGQTLRLLSFNESAVPPDRRPIFVKTAVLLMVIVALLLLIACVNVANLILVRTLARRKEFATRLALGASRGRLVRQLLTESLLIAVLAAGLSILFATWTCGLLWKFRPPYFVGETPAFGLDLRVLGFTLGVIVLATLVFGVVPATQVFKPGLMLEIKDAGAGSGGPSQRLPFQRLSVAVQVALSLVCLACAQFFLLSLQSAQRIDPGFDADRLLTTSFDLRSQGYDLQRAQEFQRRLLERVRSLPGVESAELADSRILGGWSWWIKVTRPGMELKTGDGSIMAGSTVVGPGYFRTVGIPLLQGRSFTEQDRERSRPVAVINRSLAERVSPGGNAVGVLLQLDQEEQPIEVVGVARDSKYRSLGEEPQPFIYVPLLQRGALKGTLHVRSTLPESLASAVRGELQALDATLPIGEQRTGREIIGGSLWAPRAGAAMMSVFGLVALVLAVVGVYGVTAYSLTQRRFEIGLRVALGAQRPRLLGMLLLQGMAVVAVGLGAGMLAGIWLDRWLGTMLYTGGAVGWLPLLGVAATLAAVAMLANYVPASKAAHADPIVILRGA